MSEITIREWVQIGQFATFAFSLAALSYLMAVRKARRIYIIPLWLVILHSLVFTLLVLARDVFELVVLDNFTDWSALNRLHWGMTVSAYIVIMMALRRHNVRP